MSFIAISPTAAKELHQAPEVLVFVNIHIEIYYGLAKLSRPVPVFFPTEVYQDKATRELLENTYINAKWTVEWKPARDPRGNTGFAFILTSPNSKEADVFANVDVLDFSINCGDYSPGLKLPVFLR